MVVTKAGAVPAASLKSDLNELVGRSYLFKKDNSETNCHRQYRVSCQPTLWNTICVQRSWGRQGSKRLRVLEHEFEDCASALEFIEKLVKQRLKRGYNLVEQTTNQSLHNKGNQNLL